MIDFGPFVAFRSVMSGPKMPIGSHAFRRRVDGEIRAVVRYVLGALLAFGALNAFGGGYYGLAGAKDVPTDWLEGSPFSDYFIPSLILFVVVGGALLLAAIAVFARWRSARGIAGGAGVIVLGWLAVQLAIIGYVSWMQPITAIVALVVLALASRLAATGSRMRYGDHLRSW